MPENKAETFLLLKRLVLADIFKPFKNIERLSPARAAKVIITHSSELLDKQDFNGLELSASGYVSIRDELQTLAEGFDGSEKLLIRDPTTQSPSEFMCVSISEQGIVIEGKIYMLNGLLTRWQANGKGLLHFDRRNCFDDGGNRTCTFFPFEFSNKTQQQLADIQQAMIHKASLQEDQDRDLDEETVVQVKVVDVSTTTPKVQN